MKLFKIFANQYFWLLLIILGAFLVRLYKIDSPIADWHSWRQADTAAVTRNFIKYGLNPLFPRFDDMSAMSGKPVVNPLGFRFVEFPIYNMAVYPFYLLFGVNEVYHRLVSILFSLGSIALLYFIARKYTGAGVGLLSAFTFAFLPFNVFFSRTTLPEPAFIFFSLGMLYFMDRWIEKQQSLYGGFGVVFTAAAFLMKPWAVFFFLPLFYSLFSKTGKKFWLKFFVLTGAALLPFILWRFWILQHPEGIPGSGWLLNLDGIRFRPAFWWWIVSERMGREILGATGLALFIIGLIRRPLNNNYFLHFWFLSAFLFISVFATGNVRHNYYQTSLVPILSVFFSLGAASLLRGGAGTIARFWTIILAAVLFPLSFYFGWNIVKEFYKVNNPDMVEAGREADRILPKDAVVIAPYNGDTAFLYQTGRAGWPVTALPIRELATDYGATAYISTTRDAKTNWVLRHFEVLSENPKFVIADLTRVKAPFASFDPEP